MNFNVYIKVKNEQNAMQYIWLKTTFIGLIGS